MLDAAQPFLLADEAPPPAPTSGLVARDYQAAGVEDARRFIAAGTSALLLVMATGGGKTIVAALIGTGALAKRKRILFVGPRREIIAQTFWKYVEAGVPERDLGVIMGAGVIPHPVTKQPYNARRPMAPAQVASIQTLVNRKLPPADVVFVDEAHHATSPTWAKVIEHYLASGAVVIGLTATPCRADGKGLKIFQRLHVIATFAELAARGFLITPRVFVSPRQADLSGVKVSQGGDYNQAQLAERMDKRELVGDVVEHYLRLGAGRCGVIFAASVEHSQHLAQAFTEAGVPAGHIDGGTDTDERDAVLARLRSGEILVVCNYGCLTEGWDEPKIAYVALVRPTESLALALQMMGRGLRPHPSKPDVIVVDHAGVVLRGAERHHGFPQDDREWDLDGKVGRPAAPSVRTCPKCYAANEGGTRVCTECGYEFPVEVREGPEQVDGELVEVDAAAVAKKPSMDEKVAVYAEMVALAAARGRSVGWARHRFREKFGGWPVGPRLKVIERALRPVDPAPAATVFHQLAAVVEASAEEPALHAAPEPAPPPVELLPAPRPSAPVRARRIDLAALLAPPVAAAPPPAPAPEAESWSL
ncbi:MAG: ATP-dependent helicase [Myxococcaceae bacterium]|nr:MAG: ATP-dependent helicase [Myxococcaceae bacterium]